MSIIKAVIESINQIADFSPISDEICGEIVRSISIKLREDHPLITLEIPVDLLPLFSGESPSRFLSILKAYPDANDKNFISFMPVCKSATSGTFIEASDDFLSFVSYKNEHGVSLRFNAAGINFEVWIRSRRGHRQVIYYETCTSVNLFRGWLKEGSLGDMSVRVGGIPVRETQSRQWFAVNCGDYTDDPHQVLKTSELCRVFRFISG